MQISGFTSSSVHRAAAAYTWGDRALALAGSGFGNLIGGIALVTSIRLLQMPHRIAEERTQR